MKDYCENEMNRGCCKKKECKEEERPICCSPMQHNMPYWENECCEEEYCTPICCSPMMSPMHHHHMPKCHYENECSEEESCTPICCSPMKPKKKEKKEEKKKEKNINEWMPYPMPVYPMMYMCYPMMMPYGCQGMWMNNIPPMPTMMNNMPAMMNTMPNMMNGMPTMNNVPYNVNVHDDYTTIMPQHNKKKSSKLEDCIEDCFEDYIEDMSKR